MDQKVIWDYYQGEGEDSFAGALPRLSYLVKRAQKLAKIPDRKEILNIGVGGGHLEQLASQIGFTSYSLDPSQIAIEKIQHKGFKGKVGVIESIPYEDEFFETVFCSEVLEHLPLTSLKNGVREIYRVLKQNGYLIGTVPYSELLEANHVICPHCTKEFHRWGHEQSFNKEAMTVLLKENNFNIIRLETRSFVSNNSDNLLGKVRYIGGKVLGRLGVAIANPSLFFIAQKS
jgi:SAM-dependent methyltransferase